MGVIYRSDLDGLSSDSLTGGFFDGWAEPRTPAEHFSILSRSDLVELAVDKDQGIVVGFATALRDNVQSAFVSLLEVLPAYRRRGIGTTLMTRLLDRLSELNDGGGVNVDLSCDPT